jgi:hypothetical protein
VLESTSDVGVADAPQIHQCRATQRRVQIHLWRGLDGELRGGGGHGLTPCNRRPVIVVAAARADVEWPAVLLLVRAEIGEVRRHMDEGQGRLQALGLIIHGHCRIVSDIEIEDGAVFVEL